jgi:hypothetical protein
VAKQDLIDLIELQAAQLQKLELSKSRAEELSGEVAAINDTVLDAALEMDFDDEPASHARLLRAEKPKAEDTP